MTTSIIRDGVVYRWDADMLRRAREAHGLTVTELSRRTGIPRTLLSRWEHGHWSPSSEGLRKLRDYFGANMMSEVARVVDVY
jgi:ribosome-binding protein aMBF1 (putative translation factor)